MKIFASFGVLAFLASTASAQPASVEIVNVPHQVWTFHRVSLSEAPAGVVVSGRLNAPVTSLRPPHGHVDLVAYSPDGQRIAETTTHYQPNLLSPRAQRKGGVRFSALIPHDLPPGSVIKVAFHETEVMQAKPAHASTIAK